jgi:putative acetyltransferase
MEIQIKRTNSENRDFINLVKELDAYLKITDRDEHDFYNQFNHIDVLKNIVVIYFNEIAVGCGAILLK